MQQKIPLKDLHRKQKELSESVFYVQMLITLEPHLSMDFNGQMEATNMLRCQEQQPCQDNCPCFSNAT